jgi:glycosyltransferase involved in cell wall biosynthesis
MKIAFLCDAGNPHVISRINYFLNSAHQIYYYGLPSSSELKVPKNVTYRRIQNNKWANKNKIFKLISNIIQLHRFSCKDSPDILHITWLGYIFYAPFIRSKKTVFEIMGCDILSLPQQSFLWRLMLMVFFRFSNAVIQTAKIAQENGIKYGAPKKNNHIIQIGVDFKYFNKDIKKGIAKSKLGLNDSDKFILSPRSFDSVYNIDTIIEAFGVVNKQYPDVKFVFCKYYGDLSNELKQRIKELQLENNVQIVGKLDTTTELPFFYRDAEMVISVTSSDTCPRSVTEAIACATPVIISELPWYHDHFETNIDVGVVPVKDHDALARFVIDILDGKITLNTNRAYAAVFKNINQDEENPKLEHLYKQILAEKR